MEEIEAIIIDAAEKYRNWGKWGTEDQLGTLNYITPAKITEAAKLPRQGKIFSLALPLDNKGPQRGILNRFNPIHMMLEDGGDWVAGSRPFANGIGGADDLVTMPLQCATHWDGLSHIFDHGKMWNGYNAEEVTSRGAARNGIEQVADRLVSRGVLLDIARFKGVEALPDGYAISEEDLLGCIEAQGVTSRVGAGDIVLLRTGQLGRARSTGWGTYAGGDAPGLSFWTLDWIYRTQIAALASDTWGVEVRPNELAGSFQPFHQVALPNMGLTLGEMFVLDALAADCAGDGVYEFLLIAAPLPVTGAVGAPANPQAIK
jgi:kynurenine formamidase